MTIVYRDELELLRVLAVQIEWLQHLANFMEHHLVKTLELLEGEEEYEDEYEESNPYFKTNHHEETATCQ